MDKFETGPERLGNFDGIENVGELPSSQESTMEWDGLSEVPFVGGSDSSAIQSETDWDSLADVPFAGDTN